MFVSIKAGAVAVALAASTLAITSTPAQAVEYANCDSMHHHGYRYGVAVSSRAADRQVRSGHYRPAVRPKVYWQNRKSDADKDGTACEVTR